ncbi:UvrD-helicase domain-containing protein [Plesiomonas shigelloides subsp. oncorhynchi]|nr:UvrD-helicase domain-containing protein [Plesiomonas shigelloides]
MQRHKLERGEMSFDDLLTRLSQALQQESGPALAEAIRQRYPLAMIDEFQDTDPQQYHIFHTLYGGRSDTGLLMIGDPKQAIYAFRGADIFTYIEARRNVSAHYTLDTNWRSSAGMVDAVNRLFSLSPDPFCSALISRFRRYKHRRQPVGCISRSSSKCNRRSRCVVCRGAL